MAHKSKIKISEKDREEIRRLASIGAKVEQIAHVKGLAKRTLERYCGEEMREGRSEGKSRVQQTAYEMATSGKWPAMTIFWLKTQDHWREKDRPEDLEKPLTPNTLPDKLPSNPIEAAKAYQKLMSET